MIYLVLSSRPWSNWSWTRTSCSNGRSTATTTQKSHHMNNFSPSLIWGRKPLKPPAHLIRNPLFCHRKGPIPDWLPMSQMLNQRTSVSCAKPKGIFCIFVLNSKQCCTRTRLNLQDESVVYCHGTGHFKAQCKSTHRCRICQRPHHTLLHLETSVKDETKPPDLSVVTVGSTPAEARALLDNGSCTSFISEWLAHSLCIGDTYLWVSQELED